MIEKELNLLSFGLTVKEVVYVLCKTNKIGFAHTHLHLSFVNLAEIHHLVYQTENSFSITPNRLINTLSVWISIVFDK